MALICSMIDSIAFASKVISPQWMSESWTIRSGVASLMGLSRVKRARAFEVALVVVGVSRRLENRGHTAQAPVGEHRLKALRADGAVAESGVPVAARAGGVLRVVAMQHAHALEADELSDVA